MDKNPKNNRKLSIIAFSLYFSWLLAFPFEGQILYKLAELNNFNVFNILFESIGFHFAGLILSGFLIKNIKKANKLISLSIVLCIVGSLLFLFKSGLLWHISLILISFFAGVSVAAWGFYYKCFTVSNERIKTIADGLIYSNFLMLILNMIAVNVSAYIGLFISIIFLILALIINEKLYIEEKISNNTEKIFKNEKTSFIKVFSFLCIFIIIITINSGLMYQAINPKFEHLKNLVSWYFAIPYIIAIFVIKKLSKKINRSYILFTGIAMMGLAFILFMILDTSVLSYYIVNTFLLGSFGGVN